MGNIHKDETMKLPDRPPRNEPSLEKYHYYDHETVIQDDGQIASFDWCNKERDKGWQFVGYEDKYGFHIWTEEDHKRMWDEGTRIEELLLTSIDKNPYHNSQEDLGPDFKIADDEELHAYEYGGTLSQRGGWFVVSIFDPYKILRSKQTWLS